LGINGAQIAAIVGSIIGRMTGVGSELATHSWLRKQSALGELLEVDYESLPLMTMYRAADALIESPEGTSPSGSHRTVLETLASHGSSYPLLTPLPAS